MIPKSHPRFISLQTREKLVNALDSGLVAMEGLIAQGRGEALDYLVGEKTSKSARTVSYTHLTLPTNREV